MRVTRWALVWSLTVFALSACAPPPAGTASSDEPDAPDATQSSEISSPGDAQDPVDVAQPKDAPASTDGADANDGDTVFSDVVDVEPFIDTVELETDGSSPDVLGDGAELPVDTTVADSGADAELALDATDVDGGADAMVTPCTCGDGKCNNATACGENLLVCPADCTVQCGDTICSPGEGPANCAADCCGGCGDGKCKGYQCGENPTTCPKDCGTACGNQVCDKGEDPATCPEDCNWKVCGNHKCDGGEGPDTCPEDCATACGDCLCQGGEDFDSCPVDCGWCGDGVCSNCALANETTETCANDCSFKECNPKFKGPQCNDGEPCTYDTCSAAGSCVHAPVETAGLASVPTCTDANDCTGTDHCQAGSCAPGGLVSCDDGIACSLDSCVAQGGCQHVATPKDGTPCDDGDKCTSNDICQEGVCKGGQTDCNDNNSCTADSCETGVGCVHMALDGTPCDDGSACTIQDACAGSKCLAGALLDCNDNEPCTIDSCAKASGCVHVAKADASKCSDANPCTGKDACASGTCVGTAINCDDGNPCTVDDCDPVLVCIHLPSAPTTCDDGNFCTLGDMCKGGSCLSGAQQGCDDGTVCTIDYCSPTQGCVHLGLSAGNCNDSDICTVADVCLAGVCKGAALNCSDGNACTGDSCAPGVGCTHWPVNGFSCDDGNQCTNNDFCMSGTCHPGSLHGCDDKNQCTKDTCDASAGCVHLALDATPCDDSSACTVQDMCAKGTCSGRDVLWFQGGPGSGTAEWGKFKGVVEAANGDLVATGYQTDPSGMHGQLLSRVDKTAALVAVNNTWKLNVDLTPQGVVALSDGTFAVYGAWGVFDKATGLVPDGWGVVYLFDSTLYSTDALGYNIVGTQDIFFGGSESPAAPGQFAVAGQAGGEAIIAVFQAVSGKLQSLASFKLGASSGCLMSSLNDVVGDAAGGYVAVGSCSTETNGTLAELGLIVRVSPELLTGYSTYPSETLNELWFESIVEGSDGSYWVVEHSAVPSATGYKESWSVIHFSHDLYPIGKTFSTLAAVHKILRLHGSPDQFLLVGEHPENSAGYLAWLGPDGLLRHTRDVYPSAGATIMLNGGAVLADGSIAVVGSSYAPFATPIVVRADYWGNASCSSSGLCVTRSFPDCNDGNPCTNNDCSVGTCGTVLNDCDDLNDCTVDSCNWVGCLHTPIADGTACADGLCATSDCHAGGCTGATYCDDSIACTKDYCVPETGTCKHDPQGTCP